MLSFLSKTKCALAIFSSIICSISMPQILQAQSSNYPFNCGADAYWEAKVKQNPALAVRQKEMLNNLVQKEKVRKKDGQLQKRIIPVVFHILHQYGSENISRQKVLDQLKTLNETYNKSNKDTLYVRNAYKPLIADLNIEFRLATKDPNGNCTDGIDRIYTPLTNDADEASKATSYWNSDNYLNIWVVSSIDNFGMEGTVLGYAQFPWDNNKKTDGIIVRADQVTTGNKTLTHEIGHYLGLFHIFQGGCGSSCAYSGDYICDTPPSSGPTQGCPGDTYNTCKTDNPDLPDMTENFMDYSSCSRMFTLGQQIRIDEVLNTSKRAYLVSEANLIATGVADGQNTTACQPIADFYAAQYVTCEGGTITFKDNSFNGTPSTYKWTFGGGTPAISVAKDPVIKFDKAGDYTVTLQVANGYGSSTAQKQAFVKVLPAEGIVKAPVIEDFEAFDAEKANYEFSKDEKGLQWKVATKAAAGGKSALYLNNFNGEKDNTYYVTLPPIDMTASTSQKLTFSIAYAQVLSNTNDELRVQVSSNCGQSFATPFYKTGSRLASVSSLKTTSFVPAANEWREESLDLRAYKNTKNLIIRFALKNKGGNNVYVDNINIGGAFKTGIAPNHFSGQAYMEIYPNPTNNNFTLRTNGDAGTYTLEVYDASGKQLKLMENIVAGSEKPLYLDKEALNIKSGGVYYIKLHNAKAAYVEKLIISK